MKLQKLKLHMFRVAIVLCFAALPQTAAMGGGPILCDATIVIKSIRGGSPTVSVPGTKIITAKALLQKGTGPASQTLDDTTLLIEAFDGMNLVGSEFSPKLLTLVMGQGGRGDRVTVTVNECLSGFIDFQATFTGTSSSNGGVCTKTSRVLRKTCN